LRAGALPSAIYGVLARKKINGWWWVEGKGCGWWVGWRVLFSVSFFSFSSFLFFWALSLGLQGKGKVPGRAEVPPSGLVYI